MKQNKHWIFFGIIAVTFVIDFAIKHLVNFNLTLGQKILLIPNVLSLEKAYNTGAAFSILSKDTLLLLIISFITIFFIIIYVLRKRQKLNYFEILGFSFVVGGALGNFYDRLVRLYVIDYIQLEFVNFPIFNFADIFINIGVFLLLISLIKSKK